MSNLMMRMLEGEEIPVTDSEANRSALEMICQMYDLPVTTKTMHDSWIVLTYDIPNTVEGRSIRNEFLKKARLYGAVMHTESVYMIPNTSMVNSIITKMAGVNANICVFYSEVQDKSWATKLNSKYKSYLERSVEEIEKRVEASENHVAEGKFGMARRMFNGTWERINGLTLASASYGDEESSKALLGLISRVKIVEHDCDYEEVGKYGKV